MSWASASSLPHFFYHEPQAWKLLVDSLKWDVRIANPFPLKARAQGQDLNPDHESLQAAGPEDQGAACLRFPGVKPLQAEAKNDGPNGEES
ncbi:hypothetical protein DSO57_1012079 [Entomophthora muscae]|uniref:Uncharacterized protein n=1 Tax=Entomophthora muscae TaxID=34485 RepID=A0ACC2TTG7_9FUNG|nr:hypothetical protein DSO57_1012079 [Entomophthora muscae]